MTPSTRCGPGWFSLPNDTRRYRDWKRGGHGAYVDMNEAIAESCDVYFYELAYKLGIDRLYDFGTRFGLGNVTGIDNTNERAGLLPSRAWKEATRGSHWYPGETINVGIGQGFMLATPLQIAVGLGDCLSWKARRACWRLWRESRLKRRCWAKWKMCPRAPGMLSYAAWR